MQIFEILTDEHDRILRALDVLASRDEERGPPMACPGSPLSLMPDR